MLRMASPGEAEAGKVHTSTPARRTQAAAVVGPSANRRFCTAEWKAALNRCSGGCLSVVLQAGSEVWQQTNTAKLGLVVKRSLVELSQLAYFSMPPTAEAGALAGFRPAGFVSKRGGSRLVVLLNAPGAEHTDKHPVRL